MGKPRYNTKREYENRINELRVEEGYTLKELSNLINITYGTLWSASQGYIGPLYHSNKRHSYVKPWAEKLCKVFNTELSYIWPREICEIYRRTLPDDMKAELLLGNHTLRNCNKDIDLKLYAIFLLNNSLNKREKRVIYLHFWKDYTLEECTDLTVERTRQIKAKALRKMRKTAMITRRINL